MDARGLAHPRYLRIAAVARKETIRVTADGQDLDIPVRQPVPGMDAAAPAKVTRISGRLFSTSWSSAKYPSATSQGTGCRPQRWGCSTRSGTWPRLPLPTTASGRNRR